jgi:hypothetical protein
MAWASAIRTTPSYNFSGKSGLPVLFLFCSRSILMSHVPVDICFVVQAAKLVLVKTILHCAALAFSNLMMDIPSSQIMLTT